MGLAASQARLLTITSRKSDCEYMSMKYSHQKLELAREMSEISNEYQESLNQTELYYDFYGTGDTSNPLTYSLMMTPSALNDYMPTLLTNQQGRVVLDSIYAACARAAGIPQEGLNGTASTQVRNEFVKALYKNGLITESSCNAITSTTYNNEAGLGSTDVSTLTTEDMTLEELLDYIQYSGLEISINAYNILKSTKDSDTNYQTTLQLYKNNDLIDSSMTKYDEDWSIHSGTTDTTGDIASISLYDLLSDADQYTIYMYARRRSFDKDLQRYMIDLLESCVEQFDEIFSSLFNTDDECVAAALSYASMMTTSIVDAMSECTNSYDRQSGFEDNDLINSTDATANNSEAKNYIGYTFGARKSDTGKHLSASSCSINTLLDAYLTYYAQYMEGIATSSYNVQAQAYTSTCNLVTDDADYLYSIVTEDSISTNDSNLAFFYDALFNQICVNGWTENDEITDQEYMQQMLKDGMLYISTCSDDGYYYQGNYSTNTMIKEVSDDSGIAQAEAEYTTMKAKLTAKEDELDLKMNNLDTEISSLTTEYDSVKSVIDKNIEKSFTRYDA